MLFALPRFFVHTVQAKKTQLSNTLTGWLVYHHADVLVAWYLAEHTGGCRTLWQKRWQDLVLLSSGPTADFHLTNVNIDIRGCWRT